MANRIVSDEMVDVWADLVSNQGYTPGQIAREYGVSYSTAYYWLEKRRVWKSPSGYSYVKAAYHLDGRLPVEERSDPKQTNVIAVNLDDDVDPLAKIERMVNAIAAIGGTVVNITADITVEGVD